MLPRQWPCSVVVPGETLFDRLLGSVILMTDNNQNVRYPLERCR